ncbi:hypothetical protein GCM10007940_45110 [Portibacter lacus]|uniref:T9SS C-terminal target domain-containing protein n=2 Tax=Portibacter lacus TaxID=1099794 RepID=A0AA37SYP6_9BACT|nr:hypothetical protein GCM10007940_45110 [Portibacter lacus]
MEGQGHIESQDLEADERFKVFQSLDCPNLGREKEKWYTAVPPSCQCYSKLSPADYFGKTMVEKLNDSITIGIINVAVGGCDIRLFDKDIYAEYDSTYKESWFLDKVAAYEGNPYQYLVNLAQLSQQDGVIKGILLHQGETNTGQTAWPSYVQKIYNDLLTDLSLDAMEVPILAGELVSADGNCCGSMNEIINKLPDLIPTAHIISSDGCGAADNAHFNSEGYRIIGKRYAEKMLTLLDQSIISSINKSIFEGYSLLNIYPNPLAGDSINVTFSIPSNTHVTLRLLGPSGAEISELAGRLFTSGEHTISHNVSDLPPGIYFYKFKADDFVSSKSIVIR